MNKKYLAFLIITGLILSLSGYAQEKLVSSGQNPAYKGIHTPRKSGVILQLPFIDDFSGSKLYPDPNKWTDNNAYINNTYALNQPGYGIATLDGMDSSGNIYSYAGKESYKADYLTSQAINLDLGADSTVYFSFYYQAQGLGDAPEPTDSLVVEFYSPLMETWNWAWSSPGHAVSDFSQVLINIGGAKYLQEGFRFRFINYASLADSYEPSLKVNADHWHLDYVYLNNNRHYRDTIIQDLTLIDPVGSLLLDYSSMPWEHYKSVGINAVKTLFPIHIQNLSGDRYFYTPSFTIEDLDGTGSGYSLEMQAEEIRAFERLDYEGTFNYGFTSDAQDTAQFMLEIDLHPTEADLIPENTKLQMIQEFSNYYSYDDGSAEAGYGLVGENASNGRVAVRFENFVPTDSLVGLEMYFNRSFENANHKYFNCGIWNEIDGKPGELLYRMGGLRASLETGIDEFDMFLLDSAQLVPSVFYIGWIQVTSDFLNVGFDKNNNNQDKTFFTMDGVWQTTRYNGSLMMRPVFANKSKKFGFEEILIEEDVEKLKIYPNPASSFLNIEFPDDWRDASIEIIDIQGRKVFTQPYLDNRLNLPAMKTGSYFLVIRNNKGETHHQKLLITNE